MNQVRLHCAFQRTYRSHLASMDQPFRRDDQEVSMVRYSVSTSLLETAQMSDFLGPVDRPLSVT